MFPPDWYRQLTLIFRIPLLMKKFLALVLATGIGLSVAAQKAPVTTGVGVINPGSLGASPKPAAFVPGDSVLFFDNFETEKTETSPNRWRYTFPAVIVNHGGQKWIRLKNQGEYQPKLKAPRSGRYTYEFDMLLDGAPGEFSHLGTIIMTLGEKAEMEAHSESALEESFDYARVINEVMLSEPSNLYLENANASASGHATDEVLAKKFGQKVHVAIAVDGNRFTLWFDDTKIVDVPKLIYSDKFELFKIAFDAFNEKAPNHKILVSNFRYAVGPFNLTERLTKAGGYSTSAFRFVPGTAKLTPESAGAVQALARVLTENKDLKIKITGHLDPSDVTNPMQLSKQQAEAVRTLLVTEHGIAPARIETEGKGNMEPAHKGKNAEAKANNRRLQITKI